MIKFTLLMCVYDKEDPLHLRRCLESLDELTVKPDEIVIVKDGPLTPELDEVLTNHRFRTSHQTQEITQSQESTQPQNDGQQANVNIISLPENVTLGPARSKGVVAAKNDWIAIMDSDDICKPDRFEKQLKMIESNPTLGLIGGQIAEFYSDPENPTATRKVPTEHNDILKFAKTRNPFNHMTVMFKRDAVINAGNYRCFPLFEDYDLWTRMIYDGTICANHPDVLVDARISSGTYGRRRGFKYISSEWKMQKELKKLGIIGGIEFIRNILLRIPVRLLPEKLLGITYRKVVR